MAKKASKGTSKPAAAAQITPPKSVSVKYGKEKTVVKPKK